MDGTIGVVGLGYIGLPLALCLCEKGYRVVGVDIDEDKVNELCHGRTAVSETFHGETLESILQRHLMAGRFIPTTHISVAAWEGRAYIVTVGVPVGQDGTLNETPLLSAMEQLGRVLKPGDLVLVRSTVVPGMMEEKIIPRLREASHMTPGVDFHVAYAPERVAEGRAIHEFQTLDVVLAGLTPQCTAKAAELLSRLTAGKIHVTDLRTAQLTKVIENVQRDVNIALAHQLKEIAEHHGVDVYELIGLANTHPRVRLLEPGIGVGGYCIPNAYAYLAASVPADRALPLLQLARRINETAPARMVERLAVQLTALGRRLEACTIAILGLGMKDGSNDVRHSPALACAEHLLRRGAVVRAFDPTVPMQYPFQVSTLESCLYGADGVIVEKILAEADLRPA
ncbi:nucleotide sugar dehydrogenase [Alicyclobacillus macrosporangiidus]|uniref:UDP-N-acetyl-D-mannosaminuronic acid dehydrogenase n=1 Tax=Alicyclobacillus macrosporangiidus TaxID=392015 RepID=A0A1I7JD87_9BACL|nr:nucleotide sugar dehydrogenase [Alicyclobacillus macrosporangiidus]SFU83149.1 UDP-N-acetyl-D-mannosaminuronic acid dehydrogenase [Alicyclobacillus macrosporangiidus]